MSWFESKWCLNLKKNQTFLYFPHARRKCTFWYLFWNSVFFFKCNLSCLLLGCCFHVQTGSKVVCFVFLEYRRCSRSSSKCFLCSAGCCHRNQTQSLFWCETDFQPRPVSHTVLQPFVRRPLWVCCVRRSRWADSSVMVITSGNPPCCLARQQQRSPRRTPEDLYSILLLLMFRL